MWRLFLSEMLRRSGRGQEVLPSRCPPSLDPRSGLTVLSTAALTERCQGQQPGWSADEDEALSRAVALTARHSGAPLRAEQWAAVELHVGRRRSECAARHLLRHREKATERERVIAQLRAHGVGAAAVHGLATATLATWLDAAESAAAAAQRGAGEWDPAAHSEALASMRAHAHWQPSLTVLTHGWAQPALTPPPPLDTRGEPPSPQGRPTSATAARSRVTALQLSGRADVSTPGRPSSAGGGGSARRSGPSLEAALASARSSNNSQGRPGTAGSARSVGSSMGSSAVAPSQTVAVRRALRAQGRAERGAGMREAQAQLERTQQQWLLSASSSAEDAGTVVASSAADDETQAPPPSWAAISELAVEHAFGRGGQPVTDDSRQLVVGDVDGDDAADDELALRLLPGQAQHHAALLAHRHVRARCAGAQGSDDPRRRRVLDTSHTAVARLERPHSAGARLASAGVVAYSVSAQLARKAAQKAGGIGSSVGDDGAGMSPPPTTKSVRHRPKSRRPQSALSGKSQRSERGHAASVNWAPAAGDEADEDRRLSAAESLQALSLFESLDRPLAPIWQDDTPFFSGLAGRRRLRRDGVQMRPRSAAARLQLRSPRQPPLGRSPPSPYAPALAGAVMGSQGGEAGGSYGKHVAPQHGSDEDYDGGSGGDFTHFTHSNGAGHEELSDEVSSEDELELWDASAGAGRERRERSPSPLVAVHGLDLVEAAAADSLLAPPVPPLREEWAELRGGGAGVELRQREPDGAAATMAHAVHAGVQCRVAIRGAAGDPRFPLGHGWEREGWEREGVSSFRQAVPEGVAVDTTYGVRSLGYYIVERPPGAPARSARPEPSPGSVGFSTRGGGAHGEDAVLSVEVAQWLASVGLGRHTGALARLGTVFEDFASLQAADLAAAGVDAPAEQAAILTRLRLPPPPLPRGSPSRPPCSSGGEGRRRRRLGV
jgi:hypothetical protein